MYSPLVSSVTHFCNNDTYEQKNKTRFIKGGWVKYNNRGGASEASVATLMAARDICMYDTCVRPLGQLLHAHAQMMLSQQFSKFIFTRKGNSGKKDLLCSGVGSNLGLMHCRPLPLPPSQWGSSSSGLQILLLYCCSEC